MDLDDEPYYCVCAGRHLEIKGEFKTKELYHHGHYHGMHGHALTVAEAAGNKYMQNLHVPQGSVSNAMTMHDGKVVLSVATLHCGTVIELSPGTELCHPVVVGPSPQAFSSMKYPSQDQLNAL